MSVVDTCCLQVFLVKTPQSRRAVANSFRCFILLHPSLEDLWLTLFVSFKKLKQQTIPRAIFLCHLLYCLAAEK